ncbi:uncharacterized protein MONOS_8809 [Monocercomonoides exilis]|uniref:uncharacterized protein n=1 Tax=Monocercomonoides exilis TaxID=2049356 RepID=UPI0035597BB1|nr:hypothetical protein MONOS_8809 [Monocercomonoides exilis]|eukprot:MONOS_8809.1-p1 / transcript=MONOS_8809.1 / gene=MONOS_8809 / organism=Monocercomonoides_exilis_PA203 / gene_product=unspecified product / transcript_product=unspecified product / location=Mono_scaffold00343:16472-17929(-) / protein_length=231 / sequence_SO=supercontig / SO=protein_coding / is_pseudo=false
MLSVQVVAQLPSLVASVGTKLGSKRIFAAVGVNAFPSIYDLFDPSLQIWRSPQSRRVEVKLDEEVMGRGVAVCEVGKIEEKGLSAAGLRMEDVVLSPAAIALAVLEEREEEEEGERGGKEGDKEGEEKGEEDGCKDGGREGGDGNEDQGGYPTAHRKCGLTICALIQKNPAVESAANCIWADDESAGRDEHAAFEKPAGCTGKMAEIWLRLNDEEIFGSGVFGDLGSTWD